MPCLRKKIWKVTKKCENSSKFGNIDIEEAAKKFGFYAFVDSSLPHNKYFGTLKNINVSLVNIN